MTEWPQGQVGRLAPASALGRGLQARPCPMGGRRGSGVARADTEMLTGPASHSHRLVEPRRAVTPWAATQSPSRPPQSIPPGVGAPTDQWAKVSEHRPPQAEALAGHAAPLTLVTAFVSGSFPSRLARRK